MMQMCGKETIMYNNSHEDCKPDLSKLVCSDLGHTGTRPWHRLDAIVSHHTVIQDSQARKIPETNVKQDDSGCSPHVIEGLQVATDSL